MPGSTSKKVEEPCEDWEDLDYDQPLRDSGDDSTNLSNSTNSADVLDTSAKLSTNSLLWTSANKKPQYVIIPSQSLSSTSASIISQRPLPQNAIFGAPALTILKRQNDDSSGHSNQSNLSTAPTALDLKQREKAYIQARQRIFGQSTSEVDQLKRPDFNLQITGSTCSTGSQPDHCLGIQRQPKGPDPDNPKGFRNPTSSPSVDR